MLIWWNNCVECFGDKIQTFVCVIMHNFLKKKNANSSHKPNFFVPNTNGILQLYHFFHTRFLT